MTYLSLNWSHNPEVRFSYDAAQMCQKGYRGWCKIYISKKKQEKKNDHNEEQINEVGKVTEIQQYSFYIFLLSLLLLK